MSDHRTPSMRYESEKTASFLSFRTLMDTGNTRAAWGWGALLASSFLIWFASLALVTVSSTAGGVLWFVSLAVLFTAVGGVTSHAQRAARRHNKRVDEQFERSMRRAAQQY